MSWKMPECSIELKGTAELGEKVCGFVTKSGVSFLIHRIWYIFYVNIDHNNFKTTKVFFIVKKKRILTVEEMITNINLR